MSTTSRSPRLERLSYARWDRGASYVEYLILVACIALLATAGFKLFSSEVGATVRCYAAALFGQSCAATAAALPSGPGSSKPGGAETQSPGGWQYNLTGQVTVYPPSAPGGEWRYEVSTRVNLRDQYNWDGGKSTNIGPFTVTDAELAQLHRAGLAQEFLATGKSDIMNKEGSAP